MKKKIYLVLALILTLSAFALSACTDKKEQRELDHIESFIVGTWAQEYTANGTTYIDTYTFNSDGTWSHSNNHRGTFKHEGDGTNSEYGHYEVICTNTGSINRLVLLDNYPDRLCVVDTDGWFIDLTYCYIKQ